MSVDSIHPRLAISDSVIHAVLDDEALLLDVESGVYFGLDAVGGRIWELLTEGAAPEQIVDRLADEYEVPVAQLRADVAAFLQTLRARGLVQDRTG